ncbi:hypothetical protein [Bombilactobacillus bombi]|uniref:hypothetical protein n=1 Tax=Bombilactobacillus bombi TaxID=1303590 RepID=UPI0035E697E7
MYSTGNVNIETYGTINAFSLREYYVPGDPKSYHCQNDGNQQNMQAQNVDFGEDCIYNGYTYAGNVLELTGGATVHDGAKVNLYPHTGVATPTTGITTGVNLIPEDSYGNSTGAGIYMLGGGTAGAVPQLKIGKNAQLNIQVDRKPLADALTKINPDVIYHDPIMDTGYRTPATALILSAANSKIQYVDHSNSTINLTSDGALAGYGIALIQGGVVDIGEGNMHIAANNLGASNVNLVQLGSTGKVFVNKNGSFDIQAPKATGNVNMVYSSGTFKVNVYKPKSLSIARPNTNPGSNIIYGTGSVEMRDVKEVIPNPTGTGKPITIPFQYLKLPFYGNYMYSSNSGNIMNAQTSTSALKKLNIILQSLSTNPSNPSNTQFKQFEKIDVTTIDDGPDITKNQFNIDPVQRKITGSVVDADDKTQPFNNARLHVTLQRAGSPTAIDLGDTSDDITKLDPDLDSIDPQNLSTPNYAAVEPDKVSWFADHHIAGVVQDSLTSPGNRLSKPWKYVTSSALTWSGKDNNNFSLDIDDIVRTYDKTAVNKIGTLLPSDKLTVTAVDNFQASTVYTVKISSLYLNLNDKQAKKYYVLGDDIQVPLIYQENIASSKQMNVKGYLNPTAHSTLKPNAADFSSDFTIKGDNKSNQLTWTIPATPPNKVTGSTKDYELKFYGTDDQGGQSPTNAFDDSGNILADQLISYKYTVLNLPGYSGNKQLYQGQDKRFSTETGFTNPDRLGMGNYTEKDFFAPKDDTATIDNVTFTRGDGTAADTDSPDVQVNHVVKVIATNKTGKSQTHTYITNGNSIKVLPKDFGLIAVGGSFPQGTSFEVDTNVRVLKPTKDLKLASLHMQTDFTHSDGSHEDIQLGESGQIKIGNVYYLQLTVPNRLDFGKHRVGKFTDTTYSLTNKQSVYDNLLLVYDPITRNQLKVTMQLQSDLTNDNNDIWENALFFKQTSASAAQFFQKDSSGNPVAVPVYSTTVGNSGNLPVNTHLSENWWNNSDKQVAGIFLKSKPTDAHWGKYKGQITWNLTNSI